MPSLFGRAIPFLRFPTRERVSINRVLGPLKRSGQGSLFEPEDDCSNADCSHEVVLAAVIAGLDARLVFDFGKQVLDHPTTGHVAQSGASALRSANRNNPSTAPS
jgi:hypothetical protein